MDKNSPNSKSRIENAAFKRNPLTEKIFSSEAGTNIVNLEETNKASDSSKLNVIFVGNENSDLVKKILNLDTTDPNSQQLKMSKQPKNLPENIFGKGMHTNKENINGPDSRLTRIESMLPTISKRIIYSVSDMSYQVLMKKVHTDFLYFQELCRIGTIKNDLSALHHETARFFSNGFKKEKSRFSEELNPPNAHLNAEKAIKTVHSNIKAENLNPVNIMKYKFLESHNKHSSQGLGKISNDSEESEKPNAHSIVKNEASTVSSQESTMILDNKNSNVDNSYLKSIVNCNKYSLEYPEKKKKKLSEEVNKSNNHSVVLKDASFANNRDFRMNPDKESSNARHFESKKNDSKYFQRSIKGKGYDSSEQSAKSDTYSVVTIKVSNAFKPDMTSDLDCENSNIANEKDSKKCLGSSNQHTEPLDLTVQKPQNDFNFTELESIHESPSTSEDVLSLNSSTTGENPSNISVDELTQGIILDSLDLGNKYQVNLITAKESKASILETEEKGKDLQREPMDDMSKPSVELSDSVYIPSMLTSEGNNLRSTISPETKSSNIAEESVSPHVQTTPSNINDTEPKTAFKTEEVKSDEETLPDLKKESTSSHNSTSSSDSSLLPKDLARELCFDFLHFTAKWNTYQTNLKEKLTKNQSEMETLIKGAENICRKVEDVSESASQESNEIKKSFSQLKYLIGSATSSKLTPFFKKALELQNDFLSLHTCMEQYNKDVEMRLTHILNVICEESDTV